MSTIMRRLFLGVGLLIIGGTASAQLQATITPVIQSGSPGTSLEYAATIVNLGSSTVYLNGDSSNLGGSGNTLDDAPFFDNAPLFLSASGDAGDSWTGTLFTVAIGASVNSGDYGGLFTIIGGADADAQDVLATLQFTVQVIVDNIAPTLEVPSDMIVDLETLAGTVVNYTVIATDNSGSVSVTCSPASGSLFPLGETVVSCAATDGSGNVTQKSFKVTVRRPGSTPAAAITGFGKVQIGDYTGFFYLNVRAKEENYNWGSVQFADDSPGGASYRSKEITSIAVSADGALARVYGKCTVNGAGLYDFIVEVQDNSSTGGIDAFRIQVSNGLNAGGNLMRPTDHVTIQR